MKAHTFENAFPLEHLLPNIGYKEKAIIGADFELDIDAATTIHNIMLQGFEQGYEHAQAIINKKLKPYGD